MRKLLAGLFLLVSFSVFAKASDTCFIDNILVEDLSLKSNIHLDDQNELSYVLKQLEIRLLQANGDTKDIERDYKLKWPQFFNICPQVIVKAEEIGSNKAILGALYSCTVVSEESCSTFGLTLERAVQEVEYLCSGESTELYIDNESSSIMCRFF